MSELGEWGRWQAGSTGSGDNERGLEVEGGKWGGLTS